MIKTFMLVFELLHKHSQMEARTLEDLSNFEKHEFWKPVLNFL